MHVISTSITLPAERHTVHVSVVHLMYKLDQTFPERKMEVLNIRMKKLENISTSRVGCPVTWQVCAL